METARGSEGHRRGKAAPHPGAPLVERFYRAEMGGRFRSWTLSLGQSDLWIGVSPESWNPGMGRVAREALLDARSQIESYTPPEAPEGDGRRGDGSRGNDSETGGSRIGGHELFLKTLDPLPNDSAAPPVVRAMLEAGAAAGVGPMAAVAGAVAAHVGRSLAEAFGYAEVLVENGGDLWLSFDRPLEVAVFAGESQLSGRIAVELPPELSPCGLCTSSGTVGPSLSFGYADAAVILCQDAALADAWATSACNAVQSPADIDPVLAMLRTKPHILGSLIVVGDKLGIQGNFRLRPRIKPA